MLADDKFQPGVRPTCIAHDRGCWLFKENIPSAGEGAVILYPLLVPFQYSTGMVIWAYARAQVALVQMHSRSAESETSTQIDGTTRVECEAAVTCPANSPWFGGDTAPYSATKRSYCATTSTAWCVYVAPGMAMKLSTSWPVDFWYAHVL